MSRVKSKGKKLIKEYPKHKNSGRDLSANADKGKIEKIVCIILDLYAENFSTKYIKEYLANHELKVRPSSINDCLKFAKSRISDQFSKKTIDIKSLHVARYNNIISDLLKVEELNEKLVGLSISYEDFAASRYKKIKSFEECLDTLASKEKVLKMHSATFTVNLKEEIELKSTVKPVKIKIEKLTLEEQVKLLNYIQKTKADMYQLVSVTAAKKEDSTTVDAVAEVIDTKINVEDIEQTQQEVFVSTARIVIDPTVKLREALAKEAEKKLNRDNNKSGIKVIIQKEPI